MGKAVAKCRGATEDTVCHVPSRTSVLQRVPRWKKGHLALRDTQREWFLNENIHFPAIPSAQSHTKETENPIGTVRLTVPEMTVSTGNGDCARVVLVQGWGGGGTINHCRKGLNYKLMRACSAV